MALNPWQDLRSRLRLRGMRWTTQRQAVVDVLAQARGHVTAAEILERCRAIDPATTPSTVYRTLDALEALGTVRHAHGLDGREEYHVGGEPEHGHLFCTSCGGRWEVTSLQAAAVLRELRRSQGFQADLSHLTVVGRCAGCAADGSG